MMATWRAAIGPDPTYPSPLAGEEGAHCVSNGKVRGIAPLWPAPSPSRCAGLSLSRKGRGVVRLHRREYHRAYCRCTYAYSTGRLLMPRSGGAIQLAILPGAVTLCIRLRTK